MVFYTLDGISDQIKEMQDEIKELKKELKKSNDIQEQMLQVMTYIMRRS